MKLLVAIVLIVCACSKKDDKKREAPKGTPTEAKAEKAKPLPLKAFIEPDTAQLAFKPQDILGKQPAALAKELPQFLRKDKTSAAVKAKTDELMADTNKDMQAMGIDPSKGGTDVEFRLPPTPATKDATTHVILHTADDGSVRQYGVWFRGGEAEGKEVVKTFDEIWGPNKVVDEVIGPRTTWFDPKLGIRAAAYLGKNPGEVDINYVRYMPLAKFFGEPGPLWGFEKKDRPFMGATVAEIEAAYGKENLKVEPTTATLSFPPTDYTGESAVTTILMFLDKDGKVRQWNVSLPFRNYKPARAEYEAALDAKFGKPKPAKNDHFLYGEKPTVDVKYSKYTDELDIEVKK